MPNPLYEWPENWTLFGCVMRSEAADILTHKHEEWGSDCYAGTPDDDENDIGQDECIRGYTWDHTICACILDPSSLSIVALYGNWPSLCPIYGHKCI